MEEVIREEEVAAYRARGAEAGVAVSTICSNRDGRWRSRS
jgi:hypothetical protein